MFSPSMKRATSIGPCHFPSDDETSEQNKEVYIAENGTAQEIIFEDKFSCTQSSYSNSVYSITQNGIGWKHSEKNGSVSNGNPAFLNGHRHFGCNGSFSSELQTENNPTHSQDSLHKQYVVDCKNQLGKRSYYNSAL